MGKYDAITGIQEIVEATPEEKIQREKEIAEWEQQKNAKATAEIKAQADKAAAQAKLEALGLTADDLKALGL